MSSAVSSISDLRQLVARRFPRLPRASEAAALATGIPAIDDGTGGLPRHALTELVCPTPGSGGQLFLSQLLAASRAAPARTALIDASDQFDPQSLPAAHLEHLVWVRCRLFGDALSVADIIARDANFDLLVLDFATSSLSALRRIPSTAWYRLQRAVEQTDVAFLILTPSATVPSAQLRFQLSDSHSLAAQNQPRPSLAAGLAPSPLRSRLIAQA